MGKSWRRGFQAARAASLLSNGPTLGAKLGAALYAGSNLLSVGYNDWFKTTPHTRNATYNGNTHAEAMALIKRWHYDHSGNLILYVWRSTTDPQQTQTGNGCSRPCASCMNLIRLAGVRRIRFFDEQGVPNEIKL